MHYEVLGLGRPVAGKVIDHVNGDPLDNRRGNLRVCTRRENQYNSRPRQGKKYKGVSYCRGRNLRRPWKAKLMKDGVAHQGYYATEEEAVGAYNRLAREYFGEYGWLNVWRGPSGEEGGRRAVKGKCARCFFRREYCRAQDKGRNSNQAEILNSKQSDRIKQKQEEIKKGGGASFGILG